MLNSGRGIKSRLIFTHFLTVTYCQLWLHSVLDPGEWGEQAEKVEGILGRGGSTLVFAPHKDVGILPSQVLKWVPLRG